MRITLMINTIGMRDVRKWTVGLLLREGKRVTHS